MWAWVNNFIMVDLCCHCRARAKWPLTGCWGRTIQTIRILHPRTASPSRRGSSRSLPQLTPRMPLPFLCHHIILRTKTSSRHKMQSCVCEMKLMDRQICFHVLLYNHPFIKANNWYCTGRILLMDSWAEKLLSCVAWTKLFTKVPHCALDFPVTDPIWRIHIGGIPGWTKSADIDT